MIRKLSILGCLIAFTLLPTASSAQQAWSGIIDKSRAVDWSGAGVQGGIPANRTQCGTTLSAGTYSGSTIASSVNGCPSGTYYLLGAGTFTITSGICITASNHTLRGSGADQTFLNFTGAGGCAFGPTDAIEVGQNSLNWEQGPQHTTTWTSGYAQGATQITLGSASGLSVGQYIILDQDNDRTDPGTVVVGDASTNSLSCQDEIFASDNSSQYSAPGRNYANAGTVSGTSTACINGHYPDRNQTQIVQVTGISGNNVTITPGLYMPNWRASQNPGAWWANANVQGVGIENLSLNYSAVSGLVSGILFQNSANSWVKGVRSVKSNRNHVWWQYSAHVTVQDSYFFGTFNAAAQSYGIETWPSSDGLIQNNIFQQITTPHLEGGTCGTVFAYNYAIDDLYINAQWMIHMDDGHDAGTCMNLIEGNIGSGYWSDTIHGTHNFETLFRNYFIGKETGKTMQTVPITLQSHVRYLNIIGNVLGTPGYHNNYEDYYNASTGKFNTSIYSFGWANTQGTTDPNIASDTTTRSTSMRWGNYDTVSNAVRWVNTEVPSGLALFANAVPASHNLPASFYLSAKPAWWPATVPYPPIGPDVTVGNIPNLGGFANQNPATVCALVTMGIPVDGTGSALPFNAGRCYGQSTSTISPPTNLTAIVN
jgi:hypothetical protein